ncbi:MAG: hypothetical protein ACO3ND_04705 [Opitutales bacterium]
MSSDRTDNPKDPRTLPIGFRAVLLASALYIAGCSAYFSVLGLGKLFTGAETAVMVMAASLEIGKLVAASFLYRHWRQITGTLRLYLTLAVLTLIGITSLGNYGYLARAFEETSTRIARGEAAIADLELEMKETQRRIEDAKGRTTRVSTASREDIAKLQGRLSQAGESLAQSLARVQEQRKALDTRRAQELATASGRATDLGSTLAKSIAAEEASVAKAIAAEESAIAALNERIKVLDQAVAAYTARGTTTFLIFEQDNVRKGQELREQQKPERDAILAKLAESTAAVSRLRADGVARVERLRADQSKVSTESAKDAATLRDQFTRELARLDDEEKSLRRSGEAAVAALESQLAALQEQGQTRTGLTDAEVETLYRSNRERAAEIQKLRDDIAATDIGSYRFVARAFDAEATDVVKWLILTLVAVFDPLAVTLVVAFNMTLLGPRPAAVAGTPPAPAPAPGRRGLSLETIVAIGVGIALVWLIVWLASPSGTARERGLGATELVPGDSFAVMTLQPELLRSGGSGLPDWLERGGGRGLTSALADLAKNGLDPRADIHAFAKFPRDPAASGDGDHPVVLLGVVLKVADANVAEASLSRLTDEIGAALRGGAERHASSRSRSMIRHGQGRYMDPEGGFLTFGLAPGAAVILVEFEGDPASPCVEREMRLALAGAAGDGARVPPQALAADGTLGLWLDAHRLFSRLPMGERTRTRYASARSATDFEFTLAVSALGRDSLAVTGSHAYRFDRFNVAKDPMSELVRKDAPSGGDLGWKLLDRCVDSLDFDPMIERLRSAFGDDSRSGPKLVRVEKSVGSARAARFSMTAKFDPKAGPPLVTAMRLMAQ